MKALIFDTETTGLISCHLIPLDKQPEIIEIYMALVDLETGEIEDEFDSLVKPHREIKEDSKAGKKVGITNDMVKSAALFSSIATDVKAIIEGSPLVIAHNVSFDMEMVDIEFERLGQKIDWPPARCTVEQTVHLVGKRLTLTDLHKHLFNKKFDDAHRAKNDTQALIACCCELRKRGVL